ncbi:hypothetical protein V3C99_008270 [Haemonchus contortus]
MEDCWTSSNPDCVLAFKKTSSYLRSAAKFAIENHLPLCLASAWSSKAGSCDPPPGSSNRICCRTCGLDLRNRRCFDIKFKDEGDTRDVEGFCCGCRQEYRCGEVELASCSDSFMTSGNVSRTTNLFDTTFDETAMFSASTPLNKSGSSSVFPSKIGNTQSRAKRTKKRRGSALEDLLKEDSEADRSLSGFLRIVSKN